MSSYYGDPRELPAAKDWPENKLTTNPIRWDDFKISKETLEAARNVPSMVDEAIRISAQKAMEDMERRLTEELYNPWTDRNPEPEKKQDCSEPEDISFAVEDAPLVTDTWTTPPATITIYNGDETIVEMDLKSGTVTFSENYTFDEASEIFWTSLGHDSPQALKKEIEELKSRLTAYEEVDEINKEDPNTAYERAMKLVD